jgi:hypothetical protein
VLGVARLAQLPDQPGVLPSCLRLLEPGPALRRGLPGLAPGTFGGRLGFVEDRNDSSIFWVTACWLSWL